MDKQSIDQLNGKTEKKYKRRDKKKKRTMKMSGSKVKELQRIIYNK